MKTTLLIIIGVLLGIPIITYFTIWWGVSAYHRAKTYVKQYEQECDDNNNKS